MKDHDWELGKTTRTEDERTACEWTCKDCGRTALAQSCPSKTITLPRPQAHDLQRAGVELDCHLETVGQVHDL